MKTVKLGDVCKIINGGTPKTGIAEYWDGDLLWITPKDLGKVEAKETDHTSRTVTQNGIDNSSAKIIPSNSVILSTRAPIGHVVINSKPMAFNQGCRGLVPNKDIIAEYVYFFLKLSKDHLNELGTGTTFRELSTRTLSNVEIPLPSLEEQRRIVERLDGAFEKIDRAIELTEKNIQNAKLYPTIWLEKAARDKSDSWKEAKLEDLISFKGGGTPSKANPKYWEGDIPWVSPKDMKSMVITDSIDHISHKAVEDSSTSIIPRGSVLLVVRSGILAHTIPLAINDREITMNQDMKAMIPKAEIESEFLFSILLASRNKIAGFVSKGATVHRINSDLLKEMVVRYPDSAEEQLEFARKCRDILSNSQKLHSLYIQKKQTLESLKQSLLSQAFTESDVK